MPFGADEFFPHLYHMGSLTPDSKLQAGIIGYPAEVVILGISLNPTTYSPPFAIPGLKGKLFIKPPYGLIPLWKIPASGQVGFEISLPTGLPPNLMYHSQALIGLQLSNLETVR